MSFYSGNAPPEIIAARQDAETSHDSKLRQNWHMWFSSRVQLKLYIYIAFVNALFFSRYAIIKL